MLATLATQTPMLCFGFTSAALMFFALTWFGRKTGLPALSVCQALDKYYYVHKMQITLLTVQHAEVLLEVYETKCYVL